MRRLLVFLVVMVFAAPAWSKEPTPQPACCSLSRLALPNSAILKEDTRLEAPVTLRLPRAPLSQVVKELEQQTGVRLKTSAETADEPAILHISKQPVREVMNRLAALFHYRWSRSGAPGQYRYELVQDLKAKQEEEILRQRHRFQVIEEIRKQLAEHAQLTERPQAELQAEVDAHNTAVRQLRQLPEDERAAAERRLRGQYPLIFSKQEMADPQQRFLVRLAASLTPQNWETLLEEESVLFGSSEQPGALPLSPEQVRELRAAGPTPPLLSPPAGMSFLLTPQVPNYEEWRQRKQEFQQRWSQAENYSVTIELRVGPRQVDLIVVPTATQRDRKDSFQPLLGLELHASIGDDLPDGRPRINPADPRLQLERPFRMEATLEELPQAQGNDFPHINWLNRLLWSAATLYDLNLLADGYRGIEAYYPHPIPNGEALTLRQVIERYFVSHTHLAQEGIFYTVRRHRWYTTRLAEIPERLVQEWSVRFRDRPTLELDDQAALALALRDEQLPSLYPVLRDVGLRFPEGGFGAFGHWGGRKGNGTAEMLRLYGALPAEQRTRLLVGQPLPYPLMPPVARHWLHRMFLRRSTARRRKPLLPETATGVLYLAVRNVRRTVASEAGGTSVRYQYQDALPDELAKAGFTEYPDQLAGGITTFGETPPTGGGESLQQANFLYAYGQGQREQVSILPLRIERRGQKQPASPTAE